MAWTTGVVSGWPVRSVLAGIAVTVPIAAGRLLLGTWQGIYLWEHRTHAHTRRVVITVTG